MKRHSNGAPQMFMGQLPQTATPVSATYERTHFTFNAYNVKSKF